MPRKAKKPTVAVMKDLDEIIRERTAGLPPEQEIDVVRRTILEVLTTKPEVPLTNHTRLSVALELERLWLPKKERAKIERQRLLRSAERALEIAKLGRELAGKRRMRGGPSAFEAIRPVLVKGPDGRPFQSPEALAQFIKRERAAKKKKSRR
jgi:hypothetical protein